MQAEINFQIGNQELINFMVEQQIQELREQLSDLIEKSRAMREERTAIVDAINRKAIESAKLWIENTAIPFFESAGVGKRAIKALKRGIEVGCTIGTYKGKPWAHVHVGYEGDDDNATDLAESIYRMLAVISLFKIDRASSERYSHLADEIDKASSKIRYIENQIDSRDDIERTALAQMTRKALSDNPQLMDQLRGIAASITGNTKLLESK